MEVDLRSADRGRAPALDAGFQKALDAALAERTRAGAIAAGSRSKRRSSAIVPAARDAADAPIVSAAVSVTRALGLAADVDEGSTDANIPMSLGFRRSRSTAEGRASGAHTTAETFDTTESWQGTARALLLAIALTSR